MKNNYTELPKEKSYINTPEIDRHLDEMTSDPSRSRVVREGFKKASFSNLGNSKD